MKHFKSKSKYQEIVIWAVFIGSILFGILTVIFFPKELSKIMCGQCMFEFNMVCRIGLVCFMILYAKGFLSTKIKYYRSLKN